MNSTTESDIERIRGVAVGDVVTMGKGEFAREEIVYDSCGHDVGRWYCVTHDEHFANQLQKDGHVHRGQHVLAWLCIYDVDSDDGHCRLERP